ncbi:glycosyltransferase [Paraglaciecola hydrolytica]|uniref:Glycosyl transferase family 1 n=1 Tax=Paraglaciecola hydrolytica TaxID=1799789 RepID=A0A148KMM7_9ALTE|nr:glycosyltransferase [Paraglaciecola hydrolytica]KXI27547.1 glycosyl transferase family 1 [Paraglaciecola hydrolytica]
MRILHLLKTAVGASWALRQTSELVKLGVEVHLALPEGPMVSKYQQAGVKVHIFDPSIELKKPWKNVAQIKRLRALVDEVQPDIIHSHFVATTLLMRLALRKYAIPRIFHVPGPLHLEHLIFRNVELGLAQPQDFWLASCLWTQGRYERSGIASDRVGLAYYGVNEEDFLFQHSPKVDLRKQLNLPNDSFIVGMVAYFYGPKRYLGQTRGLKGHEDLIDAIAIVKHRHPQVKCIFVGGPWGKSHDYFNTVKAYAQQRAGDACVFLGLRNDVPLLYPQFDLAVHPSHSENVGGAVESMYAQVATLTTNVGGFPDLVIDGQTGYMVEPKSPSQLAAKIIQAIEQPTDKQQMIANGLHKVSQVMNVEHNAKQVFDFYQHIQRLKAK